MGGAATEEMARRGYRVIMACRNMEKAAAVRDRIPEMSGMPDSTSRSCILTPSPPSGFRGEDAGRSPARRTVQQRRSAAAPLFPLTAEGYEQTLGVNYLGPWMLSRLMLPLLAEDAGIVNMVSVSAKAASVGRDFFGQGRKRISTS